jgi:hypothetical protein
VPPRLPDCPKSPNWTSKLGWREGLAPPTADSREGRGLGQVQLLWNSLLQENQDPPGRLPGPGVKTGASGSMLLSSILSTVQA